MPRVGVEPTSLARHDFKSCAYTSSAIRANNSEARTGIEPVHGGFADRCVTTSPPSQTTKFKNSGRNVGPVRRSFSVGGTSPPSFV